MANISSLGVGSGLDLQTLLEGLVSSERAIAEVGLNRREVAATEKLSAYGLLKNAVSQFNDTLTSLGDITTFQNRNVSVTDEDAFTVKAEGDAPLGSFTVDVLNAGTAQLLVGGGLLDSGGAALSNTSTNIGGGTLTIGQGAQPSFNVSIDAANSSLNDIADAINSAEGNTGVQASVVNSDTGPSIVLSANDVGSDNAIYITVADLDGNDTNAAGLSQLTFDANDIPGSNLTQQTAAVDAQIAVNGLTVTSTDGNIFSDAIEGVAITALQLTTQTGSATLTNDTSKATTAVGSFVEEFNNLVDIIDELSKVSSDNDVVSGGVLVGDSVVRGIESQLRRIVFTQFKSGQPAGVQSLSDIGVRFTDTGKLEVESSVLDTALGSNFDDVARLLAGTASTGETTVETSEDTYQLNSVAFNNIDTRIGRGTLDISVGGNNFTLVVNNGNRRLDDLVDAINNAVDNTGVTASAVAVDDGGGGFDYQLQLLANAAEQQVTVTVTNDEDGNNTDTNFLSQLATANMVETINSVVSETTTAAVDGTDGMIAILQGALDGFLGITERGSIDARTDGMNADLERVADDRISLDRRIGQLEDRLSARFASLDLLVSQLQSSGNFLLQQLSSISQISNPTK